MGKSVAVVELSSVVIGYKIEDEMLKSSSVELLLARTICSGKYLIVVGGSVSDIESARDTALQLGKESVIDSLVCSNVHPSVFQALGQSVMLSDKTPGALGIIETFSATSVLAAAHVAAQTANVELFRIHLAMAMGGKGLALMTGSVADVEAAIEAGAQEARKRGLLVNSIVINNPSKELLTDYI